MQPVSATALLIDVDGTLIDNSYFHAIAWWRACRRFGIEATMAQLHRLVGMVLTGGWSEAELRDAGASAVYPTLRELLTELDDSPLGARLRGV